MEISALQIARAAGPISRKLPKALQGPVKAVELQATQSVSNQEEIKGSVPATHTECLLSSFEAGETKELTCFQRRCYPIWRSGSWRSQCHLWSF